MIIAVLFIIFNLYKHKVTVSCA